MSDLPPPGCDASALKRELAALRVENRRLRNLLQVTSGVEPPSEQPLLVPPDPGVVTNQSPNEHKIALFANRFFSRRDVYAAYWENQRKGTRGWSPVVQDRFSRAPLWDRKPRPLTLEVIRQHLNPVEPLFMGLYPLLPDATCRWLAADFDGPQAMLDAHAYTDAG
jgi:hypothetical protein